MSGVVRGKSTLDFSMHPWVQRPLEAELISTLSTAESGVFLHWGVCGSGKTTTAKKVGLELQNVHGRTVVLASGLDLGPKFPSLQEKLKHRMGVPVDDRMSTFFLYPTTIIITHFDYILKRYENAVEDLAALANESKESCRFNVLVVMESWERATKLNSVQILGSPSRWTRTELEELFFSLPETIQVEWPDHEELLRRAAIAGTPGFLMECIDNKCLHKTRKEIVLDLEWQKGTRALKGASLPDDRGRFPDEDMIYHWEDIKA